MNVESNRQAQGLIPFAIVAALINAGYLIASAAQTRGIGPAESWLIIAQTIAVIGGGLIVAITLDSFSRRLAGLVGLGWFVAVPVITVLDSVTASWTGDRLLSRKTLRIIGRFDELLPHATAGMWQFIGSKLLVVCAILVAMLYVHKRLRPRWLRWCPESSRLKAAIAVATVTAGIACSAFLVPRFGRLVDASPGSSPLHIIRVLNTQRNDFSDGNHGDGLTANKIGGRDDVEALIQFRDQQQRMVSYQFPESPAGPATPYPDVLLIVIESFRPELVTAEVMPATFAYAQKNVQCNEHFSGGNSTNLGMFSLVNGLEAIWWQRPVRYSPILNRVFRSAGYELGFFGAHDDWRTFYMDGFISKEQFDVFEIEPKAWVAGDQRAAAKAKRFLRGDDQNPRLAVLYLYSTHADYRSASQDQIDQPAAADGFTIPYLPSDRQAVWRRYRNSARSIDRLIAPLLTDDRIVVITGDHGEAFLEDGLCGHGTKLSVVQNMTAAIIGYPDAQPRIVRQPTSHIDILPTLFDVAGIGVSGAEAMDGISLATASPRTLRNRKFVTCNHLDHRVLLPSRPLDEPGIWGLECQVDLEAGQFSHKNWLTRLGNPVDSGDPGGQGDRERRFEQWLKARLSP